jgi:tyrosine-protein phosphatase YwqE
MTANRERQRFLCKRWAGEHPEEMAAFSAKHYINNKEVEIVRNCMNRRARVIANPERETAIRKKQNAKHYANHREECLAQVKAYCVAHPDKVAAHHSKRRTLGMIPLNSFFLGSEAHHINKSDVIYMPKEMHRSVYHNIWNGKGMDAINKLAGAFLTEDWM